MFQEKTLRECLLREDEELRVVLSRPLAQLPKAPKVRAARRLEFVSVCASLTQAQTQRLIREIAKTRHKQYYKCPSNTDYKRPKTD